MKKAVEVLCTNLDEMAGPIVITDAMSGLAEAAKLVDPSALGIHPNYQERAMRLFELLSQRLAGMGR